MSEKPASSFRERILATEPVDPVLRQKYEQEIQAMLEKKLTTSQRVLWILTGLLSIGFVAVFGTAALMAPREFPLLARVGFGVGALFGLAWAVLSYQTVRNGKMHIRKDPKTMAGATWSFMVIMMTIFMLLSSRAGDHVWGVQMIVNGLVFFIIAAVFMINTVVEDAQLKTQEKLLEIEYRLAELAEQLKK
jgi:MFS family permease